MIIKVRNIIALTLTVAASAPFSDLGEVGKIVVGKMLPCLCEEEPQNELSQMRAVDSSWNEIVESKMFQLQARGQRPLLIRVKKLQRENARLTAEKSELQVAQQNMILERAAILRQAEETAQKLEGMTQERNQVITDYNELVRENNKLVAYKAGLAATCLAMIGFYGNATASMYLENMPFFIAALITVTVDQTLSAIIFVCGASGLYGAAVGNMYVKYLPTTFLSLPLTYFTVRLAKNYLNQPARHEE